MKITRGQLRRIIIESIQSEGLLDYVKDTGTNIWNIGTKMKSGKHHAQMVKASSEDAVNIMMAMKGLGTDESEVRKILLKRKNDLVELYKEYNNMLKHLAKMDFEKIQSYLFGPGIVNSLVDNGDLISWLEDDGLDEEAAMVEAALSEAGIEREMIDV
jgi:hypothetical protein